MNKVIANIMYYLSMCFSTIFLVDFFNPSLLASLLMGITVGVFFTTFIRPIVNLYIRD